MLSYLIKLLIHYAYVYFSSGSFPDNSDTIENGFQVCLYIVVFSKVFFSFDDTLTSTDISIGVVSCHDIFIHL
jgi:hypothetical protein